MQELRNSGDSGRERVKSEQWNDVIGAASGKETIDINKVKKALKRREQAKVKSAKEWNERTKAVERHEREGIARREGNIAARKQSKINHLAGLPDEDKNSKGSGGKGSKEGGRNKRRLSVTKRGPALRARPAHFSTSPRASPPPSNTSHIAWRGERL